MKIFKTLSFRTIFKLIILPIFLFSYLSGINLQKLWEISLEEKLKIPLTEPVSIALDGKGGIYILDFHQNRIVKFGKNGGLKVDFGRKGEGPGELQSPRLLRWREGKLIVFQEGRAEIFDEKLKFIKEIKIPYFVKSIVILGEKEFLVDELDPYNGWGRIKLTGFGKKEVVLFKFPIPSVNAKKFEAFDYFYDVLPYHGGFVFGSSRIGYEFKVFGKSGKVKYEITHKYKPLKLTEEYKRKFLSRIKRNPQVYNFVKNRLYFPENFPPYRTFFACGDMLFVERWNKQRGFSEVDLFKKGSFVGEFYFPEFDLGACRKGRIALLRKGEEIKLIYLKFPRREK